MIKSTLPPPTLASPQAPSPSPSLIKVITATAITGGDTVYLTSCDAWSRDIAVAELLDENDVDWRLAFANRLAEVRGATAVAAQEGQHGLAELVAA